MRPISGKHYELWLAREVLYAKCPLCINYITWKVLHGSVVLVAHCCGCVYNAVPRFEYTKFKVTAFIADKTNVVAFPLIVDQAGFDNSAD